MRRGCLIGIALLLLFLGGGTLGWLVGVPAVRGNVREGIEEGVATEIARLISATVDARLVPATPAASAVPATLAGDGAPATPGAHSPPATPSVGVTSTTYRFTEEQLRESFGASIGAADGLVVRLSPVGIEIDISSQGQNATYRSGLAVEDGRLILPAMTSDNGILALFLPPDDLARIIAGAVNTSFAADGRRLESVTPTDGAVALTAGPAG